MIRAAIDAVAFNELWPRPALALLDQHDAQGRSGTRRISVEAINADFGSVNKLKGLDKHGRRDGAGQRLGDAGL